MRGDIGTRSAAITFRSSAISAAGRHRRVQRWASTKEPTAGCSVPPLSTALTTTLDISQKAGRAEAPQSSVRPVIFAFLEPMDQKAIGPAPRQRADPTGYLKERPG